MIIEIIEISENHMKARICKKKKEHFFLNQWFKEEIIKEMVIYLELNNHKNTTRENLLYNYSN